jgi:hypothetical protein
LTEINVLTQLTPEFGFLNSSLKELNNFKLKGLLSIAKKVVIQSKKEIFFFKEFKKSFYEKGHAALDLMQTVIVGEEKNCQNLFFFFFRTQYFQSIILKRGQKVGGKTFMKFRK